MMTCTTLRGARGGVLVESALANFNPHAATKVDFRNSEGAAARP
jgi:hypothetical protein